MRRKKQDNPDNPDNPPTALFFDYDMAVAHGDRRKAEQAAHALKKAGYFVRALPKRRNGGAR